MQRLVDFGRRHPKPLGLTCRSSSVPLKAHQAHTIVLPLQSSIAVGGAALKVLDWFIVVYSMSGAVIECRIVNKRKMEDTKEKE